MKKVAGFEIKTINGVTTFSTDHNIVGNYDRTILTLTGDNNINIENGSIRKFNC